MATYGPNAPTGQVPFAGWSPTLGVGQANSGAPTGAVQFNGFTQRDDADLKGLRTAGGRVLRRMLRVLTGSAAGPTILETRTRVVAKNGFAVGQPAVETINLINRASTSNDNIQIDAWLDRVTAPTTYPVDLSGNGGGGKLHYHSIG
jgi:hypothetical protein